MAGWLPVGCKAAAATVANLRRRGRVRIGGKSAAAAEEAAVAINVVLVDGQQRAARAVGRRRLEDGHHVVRRRVGEAVAGTVHADEDSQRRCHLGVRI